MALNENIILSGQTTGQGSALAGGFGRGLQVRSMLDQMNQERELKPLRKSLLESQAQQAQQQVAAGNQAAMDADRQREAISIATGAMEVLPFLTGKNIDIQGAVEAVDRRSQRLVSEGRKDLSDTVAVADALESGDPQRIHQVTKQMQAVVDIAEKQGVFGKQGLASAKTQTYKNGTVLMTLPDGTTRVTNPEGVEVTGKDRVRVLKTARDEEIVFAGAKAGATARGKGEGEAEVAPLVADAEAKIASAVALARTAATDKGETLTELAHAEAALPGLMTTVDQLKELAPLVTSTIGGKIFDTLVKETGFGATEGSTAKAKFTALINNQVLPLLKPTFGAAFTVQEGESLRATMGDVDAEPAEKLAALNVFIDNKIREMQTKQRKLGGEVSPVEDIRAEAQAGGLSQTAADILNGLP